MQVHRDKLLTALRFVVVAASKPTDYNAARMYRVHFAIQYPHPVQEPMLMIEASNGEWLARYPIPLITHDTNDMVNVCGGGWCIPVEQTKQVIEMLNADHKDTSTICFSDCGSSVHFNYMVFECDTIPYANLDQVIPKAISSATWMSPMIALNATLLATISKAFAQFDHGKRVKHAITITQTGKEDTDPVIFRSMHPDHRPAIAVLMQVRRGDP